MDPASTFELRPVDRTDILRLAHIHVAACLPDNAFGLYFATPAEFEKRVTEMLESQVGDPTWQLVKAVDNKSNIIGAWASWNTPTDGADPRARREGSYRGQRGIQFPSGAGHVREG